MPLIESKRQSMFNNENIQDNDLLNGEVERTNVQNVQQTEVWLLVYLFNLFSNV